MPRSVANQRNYRKALAEETLLILEEGGYSSPSADCWVDIAEALERSCDNSFVLHEDDDLPPAPSGVPGNDVVIDVTEETSLQALYRLAQEEVGPIVLLNFASAKNPGGGFLGGAQAQEESLARSSGLYQCLMQFKDDLYANNKKDPRGGFYSHDMIFSPQVPFFRKDKGALLSSLVLCSVVSAPAVNAGVVGAKSERVMQVMQYRLRRVLHLARSQRATPTLILGAWGCGVFQNSPEDVAKLFSDVLHEQQFSSSFRRAVFAVPDAKMKSIFEDVLLGSMPRSLPAPTPVKSAWQWDVAGCDSDGYADAAEVVCASVDMASPLATPKSPELVSIELGASKALTVKLISFGYTRGGGIPTADHVFDARHIMNPQTGARRQLTGLDARLRKEVMASEGAKELFEKMLQEVLNSIARERPLVVAVGCAHGKHRSVTFCEELALWFRGKACPGGRPLSVQVWHREQSSWSKKKGKWRGARFEGLEEDEEEDM